MMTFSQLSFPPPSCVPDNKRRRPACFSPLSSDTHLHPRCYHLPSFVKTPAELAVCAGGVRGWGGGEEEAVKPQENCRNIYTASSPRPRRSLTPLTPTRVSHANRHSEHWRKGRTEQPRGWGPSQGLGRACKSWLHPTHRCSSSKSPDSSSLPTHIHDRRQSPPHPTLLHNVWGPGIYIYCQSPMWLKYAPFSRE